MKSIKMLGLVALAALMAMAFVGASSAMAESTALCIEDGVQSSEEKCLPSKLITHVHEVSVGKIGLLNTLVKIECEFLFLGDVTSANNLGSPLEIQGHVTYLITGCETTSGTICEITETSSSTTITVLKLGHELADVTYSSEMLVHCGSLISCAFNGVGLQGHDLGPLLAASPNGQMRFEEQALNKTGGAFCPKTLKLDLLTTPLVASYIAR